MRFTTTNIFWFAKWAKWADNGYSNLDILLDNIKMPDTITNTHSFSLIGSNQLKTKLGDTLFYPYVIVLGLIEQTISGGFF